MAHLDEEHENQVSDETFERIMAKSTFRTFGITNCPLCDDHGPTDSPELIEHVLGHIYDFSMYSLPWRTTPQTGLKKPIRTFDDAAPVLSPNDDEDTAESRMFGHTRILAWIEGPHPGEENLTSEQKAKIRHIDWDDYQAMGDEDGADPVVADYFDRADIDYFDDDASSCGASSQAAHSASTRRLSVASSSGYSSRAQADLTLSAQEIDSGLADNGKSIPNEEKDPDEKRYSAEELFEAFFRADKVKVTSEEEDKNKKGRGKKATLESDTPKTIAMPHEAQEMPLVDQHPLSDIKTPSEPQYITELEGPSQSDLPSISQASNEVTKNNKVSNIFPYLLQVVNINHRRLRKQRVQEMLQQHQPVTNRSRLQPQLLPTMRRFSRTFNCRARLPYNLNPSWRLTRHLALIWEKR